MQTPREIFFLKTSRINFFFLRSIRNEIFMYILKYRINLQLLYILERRRSSRTITFDWHLQNKIRQIASSVGDVIFFSWASLKVISAEEVTEVTFLLNCNLQQWTQETSSEVSLACQGEFRNCTDCKYFKWSVMSLDFASQRICN